MSSLSKIAPAVRVPPKRVDREVEQAMSLLEDAGTRLAEEVSKLGEEQDEATRAFIVEPLLVAPTILDFQVLLIRPQRDPANS